jgi:outer membrane protein TolC
MSRIKKISLFLSLIFYQNVYALTLSEAINTFEKSPRIEKSESIKTEAHWKKVSSYSGFLPDLTLKSYHMFNQKYVFADIVFGGNPASVPNLVPATVYSIGFQYPLFDGFSNWNRYQSANHYEKAAINEHQWNQFLGEREIIIQYYKTLAAYSLLDVANQNLKALTDHLSEVQLFKKAGISTKFDVLRVEVQKSEAESEVLNAKDNVENAINKLSEIMGIENSNLKLEGTLPILNKDLILNLKEEINSRMDLISLREKLFSMEELDNAESKFFVPKLSLFGEYQKYNNRNDLWLSETAFRSAYNIGISLTWNLFDGMKSISKDKVASEQKIQTIKSLKIQELKFKNDFNIWKRKYLYYCDVSNARKNDIDKAEESVRLAREGRKVGTRTNTDLLDAQSELYRAQASNVNAKLGSIESLINLEIATGNKLYNFN